LAVETSYFFRAMIASMSSMMRFMRFTSAL